jgi:hypothetical protein
MNEYERYQAELQGRRAGREMAQRLLEADIAQAMVKNAIKQVPTVRVSAAQAKGKAARYAYYGAVRYAVLLVKDRETGMLRPSHKPLERATSDRRSYRLAKQDAERLAGNKRIVLESGPGRLSVSDLETLLEEVSQ